MARRYRITGVFCFCKTRGLASVHQKRCPDKLCRWRSPRSVHRRQIPDCWTMCSAKVLSEPPRRPKKSHWKTILQNDLLSRTTNFLGHCFTRTTGGCTPRCVENSHRPCSLDTGWPATTSETNDGACSAITMTMTLKEVRPTVVRGLALQA